MKQFLIVVLALWQSSVCFPQKWDHIYGNSNYNESIKECIGTYDKGYLLSSSYELTGSNWLVKTDINGEILWEKNILWDKGSIGRTDITQDQEGNIITGFRTSGDIVGKWPRLVKLNPCGEKIWCRIYKDEEFENGAFHDVLILDSGDILAMAYMDSEEGFESVFLYYVDKNGNLLWKKSYATQFDHPHIRLALGSNLHHFGDNYFISGSCYYPYPSDTTLFIERSLFIKIDSSFEEEWVLPFGVNETIISRALNLFHYNDTTYLGLAMNRLNSTIEHTLLIYIDNNGNVINYFEIPNDSIGPDISQNYINEIERINDTLFLGSIALGIDDTDFFWGELVIDSTGKIYKQEYRSVHTYGWSSVIKTFDNKFTIGTSWREGTSDVDLYLYKINQDLELDTVYPGNYTYDSLCPYQIQSGEVDISDCLIVVDVKETPTPQEYYASLNTIPIKAYPNPVNGNEVTFELQNTEHHKNMELKCFDVFGKDVYVEKVYQHQGVAKINISNWKSGIYFTIIYAEGKPIGECKFVVR